MKKKLENLELKYVNQKNDGLEAWLRFKESDWIRLDFILEYYLFENVNLAKEYKGQLRDESTAKHYFKLLFERFSEKTSGGEEFDFKKYISWQKNNLSDINNALKLLNN